MSQRRQQDRIVAPAFRPGHAAVAVGSTRCAMLPLGYLRYSRADTAAPVPDRRRIGSSGKFSGAAEWPGTFPPRHGPAGPYGMHISWKQLQDQMLARWLLTLL